MKVILRTLCGCERIFDTEGKEKTWAEVPRLIDIPIVPQCSLLDLMTTEKNCREVPWKIRRFRLLTINCLQHPFYIEEWPT